MRTSSQIYIGIIVFQFIIIASFVGYLVIGPYLTTGEPVELKGLKNQAENVMPEPFTVTVTQSGEVYINEDRVMLESVATELGKKLPNSFDTRIYLRADEGSDYGVVMKVMARVNSAGFSNIGLITDPASPAN